MDKDRNKIQNHPKWPFRFVPIEEAWKMRVITISREAALENRHEVPLSDLFVMLGGYAFDVDGATVVIRRGFVTDWASVPKRPKFLRKIIVPNSQDIRRASVIHDALYNWKKLGWHKANQILHDIMLEDGASKTKARLVKFGVETKIGKYHWDTTTRFDIENSEFSSIIIH